MKIVKQMNKKSIDNGIPFHDQHDIVARLATLYKTGGFNLSCNYRKAGEISFEEKFHRKFIYFF